MIRIRLWPAVMLALLAGAGSPALAATDIGLVLNVYNGDRSGPATDTDAVAMAEGGLREVVESGGGRVVAVHRAGLSDADEGEYGRWNRYGLVSGHFADRIVDLRRDGVVPIGLYNNCNGALGMLGGLRHAGASGPQRVGLVWIDAHGDYNTPETTLSGMLGGMPVAIAAGDGLHRMRRQARIDVPLRRSELLMVAVRDTDPLEEARIVEHGLARLSTADLRERPERVRAEIERLGALVDAIYVHIDLDVLDPAEVPGHPLTAPDGPSSAELADALALMFAHPKTVALGLASYPHTDDPGGVTMRAIHRLVDGSLRGLAARDG
jgi:arginase